MAALIGRFEIEDWRMQSIDGWLEALAIIVTLAGLMLTLSGGALAPISFGPQKLDPRTAYPRGRYVRKLLGIALKQRGQGLMTVGALLFTAAEITETIW